MTRSSEIRPSLDNGEAALGRMVGDASTDRNCGGRWTYELTDVVKHCGVIAGRRTRILQVNPFWLRELSARREMEVLADEMRTWSAIQNAIKRHRRHRSVA